mgnify:CR=1 FL=1
MEPVKFHQDFKVNASKPGTDRLFNVRTKLATLSGVTMGKGLESLTGEIHFFLEDECNGELFLLRAELSSS